MPTVRIYVSEDQLHYLEVKAGNDGFRKNKPRPMWSQYEREEAARFALKQLLRDDMERNMKK